MSGFVGRAAVSVYSAIVVASALDLYARTGMKANRAYTPANMRRFAESTTGKKFRARDYAGMAEALRAWAKETAATKCVSTGTDLVDREQA